MAAEATLTAGDDPTRAATRKSTGTTLERPAPTSPKPMTPPASPGHAALIASPAPARRAPKPTVARDPAVLGKTASAGGRADPNPPQDYGLMFGRSVEDPDGNVWEIMWMDPAGRSRVLSSNASLKP